MPSVFVVDMRMARAAGISNALRAAGHSVRVAVADLSVLKEMQESCPALVCLAVDASDSDDSLRLLEAIRSEWRDVPVVAYATATRVADAVAVMKRGACEYMELPREASVLLTLVGELCDAARQDRPAADTAARLPEIRDRIVAASPAMGAILAWTHRIGPTELPVLLIGETGTGKEVVARAVHASSRRCNGPFVPINCGAIPESLFEAEMFGYCKGAFSGALATKRGLFETAHAGTVFLDEIGELRPAMQVALLRFLEDGVLRRLGETNARHVDVRVVAATNRALDVDAAHERFRLDLYFRLSVATCVIPPLRERVQDLDALVARWLPEIAARQGVTAKLMTPGALSLLRAHAWPGNVRELRNVLEHAISVSDGPSVAEDDIKCAMPSRPPCKAAVSPTSGLPDQELASLVEALQSHRWKINQTAASLGVSRSTLWRRLSKYGFNSTTKVASVDGMRRPDTE